MTLPSFFAHFWKCSVVIVEEILDVMDGECSEQYEYFRAFEQECWIVR